MKITSPYSLKRAVFVLLLVSLTGMSGHAQEFWLRSKKLRYAMGEEVKVDFVVGENFTGEFWDMQINKVEKLELITSVGRKELTKTVKPSKGSNLVFKLANQGTQLIAMQSAESLIELDAEVFNAYLTSHGLENVLQRRKDRNELGLPAKERSQRFAKLLVQSGTTIDEVYKRNVGQRLEIIPRTNPAKLRSGDYLECNVLFENKPLAHQLVKVFSIVGNSVFLQNMYTENDGTIKFPISSAGPWMVSTVRMLPSEVEEVDYESYCSSLVFGVD